MRYHRRLAAAFICLATGLGSAATPVIQLGPKPSFGLFQPRVEVEIFADKAGIEPLGPNSNSFLLDTGANGALIYAPAITELIEAGFQNEGQYEEAGVSGTDIFDVSAPYRLDYSGAGATESLEDVRFLSSPGAVDATGLLAIHGIMGMPAMEGRVTTMDNTTRLGTLSMGVSFGDNLPQSSTHRFTVPLEPFEFPIEDQGGPIPTFSTLSTMDVVSRSGTNSRTDKLVLDTGAQVTIISEAIAFGLGLDANGDGSLEDDATSFVPIGGVGGTVNAPVLQIDEFSFTTDQGFELSMQNASVLVRDIHPLIDGVVGADFFTGDGGLDLNFLGGGTGGLGDLLGGDGGLGDLLGGLGDLGDLGGLLDLLGGGGGLGDLLGGGDGGLGDLLGGDLGGLLGGDLGGLLGGGDGGLDDLLGGLLGGGFGSDPFATFPLESYFDAVHFDFREFPAGNGQLVLDVNPEVSATVLNGDGRFDVTDIDDLVNAFGSAALSFDLDGDGGVDANDKALLISEVFRTVSGDTDLDRDVDFADFLGLSAAFGSQGNGWGAGDFDGNGRTDFPDFLAMSSNFGALPAAAVPEPDAGAHLIAALGASLLLLRRRHRSSQ
jgi:hypothetical protein